MRLHAPALATKRDTIAREKAGRAVAAQYRAAGLVQGRSVAETTSSDLRPDGTPYDLHPHIITQRARWVRGLLEGGRPAMTNEMVGVLQAALESTRPRLWISLGQAAVLLEMDDRTLLRALDMAGLASTQPTGAGGHHRIYLRTLAAYLRAAKYAPEDREEYLMRARALPPPSRPDGGR